MNHHTLSPHSTGLETTMRGNSIPPHHCLPPSKEPTWSTGTRYHISRHEENVFGNFRCGTGRCKTCPILVITNTFVSKVTGKCFKTEAAHLLQNIKYNFFNTMQEVWSPVCGRNRATPPEWMATIWHCSLPNRRIPCDSPCHQWGPFRDQLVGHYHRHILEGGHHS